MGIAELLNDKKDQICRIAARHGASNVRVFGSVARGEARADSDVDILVDLTGRRSFFFPGGLIADLSDLLGRKVEVVTEDALDERLRHRILSEAVHL